MTSISVWKEKDVNQNPNEYNPYAQPPSGPNYPPTPNSGYGGPPSSPNYPPTPNSGYGGSPSNPGYPPTPNYGGPPSGPTYPTPNSGYSGPPSNPGYLDPTAPTPDYGAYPSPSNPVGVPPTSYGPYDNTYAPPPPVTPNYGAPNYATPAYPPVPPTTPPNKPARGKTGLIVAIVLLVVIVAGSIIGVVAYNNNQTTIRNNNATATAQTILAQSQAHATATAGSFATATAIASTYPFFPRLALNDPMSNNSNAVKYGWESNKFCYFSGNAYQALDDQKNTYGPCAGIHTNFSDYTFQVDVTMKQGDNQSAGGLYFRANESKNQGYIFTVDQQGNYTLWIATDATANNSRTLKSGTVSNFTPGLGQTNTLGVVVRGSQIALYVGSQLITTIQDSTYSSGQIGFISSNTDITTIMSYNNVKVWTA